MSEVISKLRTCTGHLLGSPAWYYCVQNYLSINKKCGQKQNTPGGTAVPVITNVNNVCVSPPTITLGLRTVQMMKPGSLVFHTHVESTRDRELATA